jgi:hypothetical protein
MLPHPDKMIIDQITFTGYLIDPLTRLGEKTTLNFNVERRIPCRGA